MELEVYKFGGASVKDVVHCNQVAKIVADNAHKKLVVIVSAIGKTTNALEGAVLPIINKQYDEADDLLEAFIRVHLEMATEMELPQDIRDRLQSIGRRRPGSAKAVSPGRSGPSATESRRPPPPYCSGRREVF